MLSTWRQSFEKRSPELLPFVDAVAEFAAREAAREGDEIPHRILVDQAGGHAVALLSGVEFVAATAACEELERRAGESVSTTAEEREQMHQVLQNLRDDPALLEAFGLHAALLPAAMRRAVELACDVARRLGPKYDETRSRLKINARSAIPEIEAALAARMEPFVDSSVALVQKFERAQPWEIPALMAERDQLLAELDQAERETLADIVSEEYEEGLIRWHPIVQAIRGRIARSDDSAE